MAIWQKETDLASHMISSIAQFKECFVNHASPRYVYELYIRASARDLWDIITNDEKTHLYQHFNMTSHSEWRKGGHYAYLAGETALVEGEILDFDPPRRLVSSFRALWSPEVAADPPSTVSWEIQALSDTVCKLTLIHENFGGDTATSKEVPNGWPEALSRLKTLAETGTPFLLPPSP